MSRSPRKDMEVYVELPPVPKHWKTPISAIKGEPSSKRPANSTAFVTPSGSSSHRMRGESVLSDATKQDESEDELALGSVLRPGPGGVSKSGGLRTGERDQRGERICAWQDINH